MGVTIMKYQMCFLELTKKMFENKPNLCQMAIINIRLDELQQKGSYMIKCNKPTNSGTKITFQAVKNLEEYTRELARIVEDGEKLGMKFEIFKKQEAVKENV